MAALLVLLLLLAVPLTTSAANVYYVTADDAAGHDLSCPPHQICHNLSYYIFQPEYYFNSDTIFIFLEGQHSYDKETLVQVKNVHKLTLKGQGEWPVAGPEETVMQSTVIINCTRGRGGFIFDTGYDITIECLTITNCGKIGSNGAAFNFINVLNIHFQKNSLQYISGFGMSAINCNIIKITNCSYYLSQYPSMSGGLSVVIYKQNQSHYEIDFSFSNITKCLSEGIFLYTNVNLPVHIILTHLVLSKNKAEIELSATNGFLSIFGCLFLTEKNSGGLRIVAQTPSNITISNSHFVESYVDSRSLGYVRTPDKLTVSCDGSRHSSFLLSNSTIVHNETKSDKAVFITHCSDVQLINTKITIANQLFAGILIEDVLKVTITNCLVQESYNLPSVVLIRRVTRNFDFTSEINNCIFSKNTGGHSVITLYDAQKFIIVNSSISDNGMTGITAIETDIEFHGHNVIQNNRYTEGAGITLILPGIISVSDELRMINNTAELNHGGAILVIPPPKRRSLYNIKEQVYCTIAFLTSRHSNYSSIFFSGNTAHRGGDDIYGAILMGCMTKLIDVGKISHIGQNNETSWYFDTPVMKHLHLTKSSRLSSMSSDPIMICFCNSTSNLPDCSDRTPHHIQTYPGLEINTTIATVGYYGGTSPGVVQVSAQHAKLVHSYGQDETINCFRLHILLQNSSSTTALVDIKVKGGLWDLSLTVDILECPTGFVAEDQNSGQYQCHCVPLLADNHVKCNVSLDPYKFLRSDNSWFAYINNTQSCITGTTNCPFDYCNRSNVSFDILVPDRQCLGSRTGILCGQCQSNLSIMLGSNRCGTCSNWYLLLLPVFGLAGIVLVAVLMFLNLSVSVGTINGLLFYANIVKLNEAFYFPNGSIPVVSQFISWLNLDLGIEVCLFDGLDGYWNTWLQFAFPVYLFLLMGGIVVGCRYSVWLCRLCGSHAVPALATLFLMSYTKILLTVTDALSMSQLPCNDSILTVWSVDGNIEYGSWKHLILVVVSCGVLVIGLAYPVLVLCAPLLERYSHKCIPQHRCNPVAKFKPLLDAYGGPYKDKYRFWTGVTLMVRLILTVIFSFTSGRLAFVNASIISTVIVGIFTIWSFVHGVYRSVYISALESFYLFNIFLLNIVCQTTAFLSLVNQVVTTVSISLSFGIFLISTLIQVKQSFDFKKIKRKLGFKDQPKYIEVPQIAADEDDEDKCRPGSPPSIVYGSQRGEHQFVLEIAHSSLDEDEESLVLLEREPLMFDTNTNF